MDTVKCNCYPWDGIHAVDCPTRLTEQDKIYLVKDLLKSAIKEHERIFDEAMDKYEREYTEEEAKRLKQESTP